MFEYSEFKRQMLDKIPAHEDVTLYRCGPLIDLCRGPHVPHTGTPIDTGASLAIRNLEASDSNELKSTSMNNSALSH
ncbi:hypothetical protein ATCC90586_010510 [Pythium insidiosum]|nr:hypothetical protein ATCC90586_010510 [Pythium insidiosum]